MMKLIATWEAEAGAPLLVLCIDPRGGKAVGADDVPALFECLRPMGTVPRLDLLLVSEGGNLAGAHRIAQLLREYTSHLRVIVPFRARSAATLVCLAANEIVIGPLGELSPLDPQVRGDGAPGSNAPESISAEDIRVFRKMAEDWFKVPKRASEAEVLQILTQRFYPTALSASYRASQYAQHLASELLQFQLPMASRATRDRIANRLVAGYYSHQHGITRLEAARLGLNIRACSPHEGALAWQIWEEIRGHMGSGIRQRDEVSYVVRGVCATRHHAMEYVVLSGPGATPSRAGGGSPPVIGWRPVTRQ